MRLSTRTQLIVVASAFLLPIDALAGDTRVAVRGDEILHDGRPVKIVGLRCSNALISDKTTDELMAALELYRSYGLNTVSVLKQANPSLVVANNTRQTTDSEDLNMHFGALELGKPWFDSEATPQRDAPGGYWGRFSKQTHQADGKYYNYSRIGRYTSEMKERQLQRTRDEIRDFNGHVLASTWLQCAPYNAAVAVSLVGHVSPLVNCKFAFVAYGGCGPVSLWTSCHCLLASSAETVLNRVTKTTACFAKPCSIS